MSQHLSIRDGFASLAAFYLAGAAAILVARVVFLKRDLNPPALNAVCVFE